MSTFIVDSFIWLSYLQVVVSHEALMGGEES